MYEQVLDLCRRFLACEPAISAKITAYEGNLSIEGEALVFGLADLFDFLSSCKPDGEYEGSASYQEFRRALYQSTLNQDLRALGGQIVVHQSTGKVETNLYRLERCPAAATVL